MQEPQTVRWAILSAGRIAHKFAHDFKAVHNARLAAVATRNPERGQAFARQYGVSQVLDYEELYASSAVDIVYVATPHNFHFAQSLACLRSGKAVLCEKPITTHHTAFAQLAAEAKRNSLFLMEGMWTYFLPAVQQAKEWVRAGAIGAVQTVQADFCFPMEYDPASRLFDPALAGGALLDLGVYPVALALFFTEKKPDIIKATAIPGNTGVDESTALLLKWGGVSAFLHCSIAGKSLNRAVITGEKGFIELPDFYRAHSAFLYNGERALVSAFSDDRKTWGFNFETQEATHCVLQGKTESPVMPHERSLQVQEVLTEVRRQIGLRYPWE